MARQYRKYSDDDIIENTAKVTSLRQLLIVLGLKPIGGNYAHMRKTLQRLGITADHWTGEAWNKEKQAKDWSDYTRASNAKPHLIRERGHMCEKCKRTEWYDAPITLELHHVDGDRTHNTPENWQLLCPNCHSYTDSWRKPQ